MVMTFFSWVKAAVCVKGQYTNVKDVCTELKLKGLRDFQYHLEVSEDLTQYFYTLMKS